MVTPNEICTPRSADKTRGGAEAEKEARKKEREEDGIGARVWVRRFVRTRESRRGAEGGGGKEGVAGRGQS